jgi:predicted phage baseplate assembly protein
MTDGCGCERCRRAPSDIHNRPGLPSVSYRLGTHPTFVRRLLSRLPSFTVDAGGGNLVRPLADLTTREVDDPSVSLIDAWATVADVITFYQERIANEGWLRTSSERGSILELARTIGYELNPGVAAGAFLAFIAEDAPGAPGRAQVPIGTKVQSVPGQDERPQTFETVETIEARAEWNSMRARATRLQLIQRGLTQLYLAGLDSGLQVGDAILLVGNERIASPGSERWDVRVLDEVIEDLAAARTLVRWSVPLGSDSPTVDPAGNPKVFAFRRRAALFGHNAPDFRAMPLDIKRAYYPNYDEMSPKPRQWPDFDTVEGEDPVVHLDADYPKVLPETWVAFTRPGYTELYRVLRAEPSSRTDFTLTAKTTRVVFDTREHLHFFGLRQTMVLAETEQLDFAEEPIDEPVVGDEITLIGHVPPLEEGRAVVVTGRRAGDPEGADAVSEVRFVSEMSAAGDDTRLRLTEALANSYVAGTVTVAGNVARCTHGETVTEVLGNGRGEIPNQSFALKKPPLTFVSAATATGSQSTLEVRVDGVKWDERGSLFGADERTRAFVVRMADDGATNVIFGDGVGGARLPTGLENVRATYRSGLGLEGLVGSESISLLTVRPLGIRSVSNPLPSEGAAAAESRDDARRNAPKTVLTLDRIVSLSDYEDFARSFAGVGKALASDLWDGERRIVHVTVAGVGGEPITPSSDTFVNLRAAIEAARDLVAEVIVENFHERTFAVAARVLVDAGYIAEEVLTGVGGALGDAFSFENREFGQPVTASEVMHVVQEVEGVVACDLDALYATDDPATAGTLQELLTALVARWEGDDIAPAQLLLIDPGSMTLTEMT